MANARTYPRFLKQNIDSARYLGVWAIWPNGEQASIGTVRTTTDPSVFEDRCRDLYDDQRHHWEK